MSATLKSRIPEIRQRMHRATGVGLHRAADSHVAVAQQLAPRDTGLMADTTHKEPEELSPTDSSSVRVDVIAPQPYSGFVEFGTVGQEAQPWFLPAFESAKRQYKAEAKQVTETVLKGGTPPTTTIGVRRSVTQRQGPTAGVVRKVREP
jgi:HK97 gp10 family phage protein